MITCLRVYTLFTTALIVAGCSTQNKAVRGADYESLRQDYLHTMSDDEATVIGELVVCNGVAGSILGVGCHLALIPIAMPDGTTYLGVVSSWRKIKPGQKIRGRFVFVEVGALLRSEQFVP